MQNPPVGEKPVNRLLESPYTPVALLLAGVLCIWQFSQTLRIVQFARQPITLPASKTITSLSEVNTNYQRYHLFGRADERSANQTVPLSQLNFTIIGIFQQSNPADSAALIDTGDGQVKRVRVGDGLPQDVKVYKIQKDAVILERDGRIESLPIDKNPLHFQPPASELPNDGLD